MNFTPSTPIRPGRRDLALGLFLALLLFGCYMFTFDGTLHSSDGLSMFAVAENIIKHGRFDTAQLEDWENVYLGVDGRPYTNFAPGPTLAMLPFVILALNVTRLGLVQTTLVLMPLSTAFTATYVYLSSRRLGYPAKTGLAGALLAGLATMAWLRTRDLVADPLMLLSFTATFYHALAYRQDRRLSHAVLMGLALSVTTLHKVVNIMALPFFFWYLAGPDLPLKRVPLKQIKIDWPALISGGLAWSTCLPVLMIYNTLRFGHPLDTGYPFLFTTPFWVGFTGFLISPYKSLFLYVPLFLLIPFTLKQTWQKHAPEVRLIMALLLSHMLLFGAWYDWGGGGSWGPRFLAPLNALLTLLLLPYLDRVFQPGQWRARLVWLVVGSLSLAVQLIGLSARDDVYLDLGDYWTPPPDISLWGGLGWDQPEQWPIWGHLLRFDPGRIPVIWRWDWFGQSYFDPITLLVTLLIIAVGTGGVIFAYRGRIGRRWAAGGWLVAAAGALLLLWRSYDDPRAVEAAEAAALWPAYRTLAAQLPAQVGPGDAVIFTNRRFEFYLLNVDKAAARRYVIAKPNQPIIRETIPRLLEQDHPQRVWLVTDAMDNRQLAYAVELWLAGQAHPTQQQQFGDRVQLTTYEPDNTAAWPTIPATPQISQVVEPERYTFNGIAALLGWHWPELNRAAAPVLATGQTYDFELYWIYRGKAPEDRFFVRLLDEAGSPALEVLTTPRSEARPAPGQLLIEDMKLAIPANLPPGRYRLQIGFTIPVVETGELIFELPEELTAVTLAANPSP